jgi:hypothetical protein
MQFRNVALALLTGLLSQVAIAQGPPNPPTTDVNVVNTPDVNVANMPDVNVANTPDVNVANMPDVNVANTPDVNVANVPDVKVTNDEASPISVSSVVRRTPVLCVVPTFQGSGQQNATCVSPTGGVITPVPSGFFLAITDVIATSQQSATTSGQSVIRVSSKNQGGIQFGAGVAMVLKPGETQSLHYQSPHQVLPAGRTPTASVGVNFGNVFPVEVHLTGYLVAVDDLGR